MAASPKGQSVLPEIPSQTSTSLAKAGSMLGSAGTIVMDDSTCMVWMAERLTYFYKDESCGKCTPCRVGGTQLLRLLNRFVERKAKEKDLATVRRMANAMQKASLCGLGQTASNPVLSALRYFEPEFRERLAQTNKD